jgi:hypothetical protein
MFNEISTFREGTLTAYTVFRGADVWLEILKDMFPNEQ